MGKQKGNVRTAFALLKFNWPSLWRFELFFILASAVVVSLVSGGLMGLAMRLEGVTYLALDNTLRDFALNPLTWIAAIICVLAIVLLCLFEESAFIYIFDASRQHKRVDVGSIFRFSWANSTRIFKNKGRNALIVVAMIILMPVLSMGVLGTFFASLQIPEFIMEAIEQNTLYSIALVAVTAFVLVVAIRWFFVLHYFTLENLGFMDARRKSVALARKKRIRSVLMVIVIQACVGCVTSLIVGLGAIGAGIAYLACDFTKVAHCIVFGIACVLALVLFLAVYIVGFPSSTLALSVIFYREKAEKGEPCEDVLVPAYHPKRGLRVFTWILTVLLSVVCALAIAGGAHLLATSEVPLLSLINQQAAEEDSQNSMEITAHRGGSHDAPENTMAAFRNAYAKGADWCELDVQMSADGVLFIMHDSSFERTCGVAKSTSELTWDEICTLDASNGWSEYAGEHVPSLEEVIDWAKETGMKLNIELKPSGNEPESLEEAVVAMVNEKDFKDQCWIASLDYRVLETVKEIDPTVQTLINMTVAIGTISAMPAADNYSLESSMVTESIVEDVHGAGKKLCAWTVNDETNMARVISLGIDNLVTDEIVAAQNQESLLSVGHAADVLGAIIKVKDAIHGSSETVESTGAML